MLLLILLSLGAASRHCDTVDLIEINHSYRGDVRTDQVIYWEWSPDYSRMDVVSWHLYREVQSVSYAGGWHTVVGSGTRVRSRLLTETWTAHDPERSAKRLMNEKYRRGLSCR